MHNLDTCWGSSSISWALCDMFYKLRRNVPWTSPRRAADIMGLALNGTQSLLKEKVDRSKQHNALHWRALVDQQRQKPLVPRGCKILYGSEFWMVMQEHLLHDSNETTYLLFLYRSTYPILINVWVIPLNPRTWYNWHHRLHILHKINALITANEVPCLQRRRKNLLIYLQLR